MQEYLSEAIILDKEPNGDLDVRFSIFTKKFGKLTAKAKSARKITSKLAPHLEPGNVAQVRLIEQRGLQVVDALKRGTIDTPLAALHFLNELLPEGEPEKMLWNALISEKFLWEEALAILGWDPRGASCAKCGANAPSVFDIRGQEFFCRACGVNLPLARAIPLAGTST